MTPLNMVLQGHAGRRASYGILLFKGRAVKFFRNLPPAVKRIYLFSARPFCFAHAASFSRNIFEL